MRHLITSKGRGACVLRLSIFAWICSLAAAQLDTPDQSVQVLKQLTLEELSQLEVTSPAKAPTESFRTPMALFVITSDDIRRSGATTIPDVLRLAPGVEVARVDSNKYSVGIRGFGSRLSRSVLVLIDGRTVYTTFFAGTYWEVQDTFLDDIERIEVIRGPGGTIWGPNAVNGVINIVTKPTKNTHGHRLNLRGGNEEQGAVAYRYGGGNGRNLDYRIYGKAYSRGPQIHTDRANFDDWRGAQSGFRLDWAKSDRDTVILQGDLYRLDAGQRVPVINYTPPFRQVVQSTAPLSGGNLMARWIRKFRDEDEMYVQAFYDRTNRYEANFGENRDTVDVDFIHRIKFTKRQRIIWGLGGRASDGRAIETSGGLKFDPISRTDTLLTAFLQDEVTLPRNVTLTLGTKLLRTNFSGPQFEPSVRLLWTPTSKQAYWASFTRAVRTPSRVERDFSLSGYVGEGPDNTPFFARFNANPTFETERMIGWEIGHRYLVNSSLYVDSAAFRNRYDSLFSQEIAGPIALESSPGVAHLLLPARFSNSLFGTTTGGEIAPEWRPVSHWRLRPSYAYVYMNLDKVPGSAELGTAPIVQRTSPRHQVVVQSSAELPRSLQLDLTYRYVSSLPGQKIAAYSTGDARLAWRFHRRFELSVVGRNLLQPGHEEFPNDPGPTIRIRRSAYLQLSLLN